MFLIFYAAIIVFYCFYIKSLLDEDLKVLKKTTRIIIYSVLFIALIVGSFLIIANIEKQEVHIFGIYIVFHTSTSMASYFIGLLKKRSQKKGVEMSLLKKIIYYIVFLFIGMILGAGFYATTDKKIQEISDMNTRYYYF